MHLPTNPFPKFNRTKHNQNPKHSGHFYPFPAPETPVAARHTAPPAPWESDDVQRGNENEFRGNEKRQISKAQRPQRLLANFF